VTDSKSYEDDDLALVQAQLSNLLLEALPLTTPTHEFLNRQFDHGLAWVHFPAALGGLGVDKRLQAVVDTRLRAAGAQPRARIDMLGYMTGGPTVLAHGTRQQQERYLRPAFICQERWCQLFSEPGAGSDLASVATRARRADGGWLVTGQKVWSSYAHIADIGMALVRTNPDVPKHHGLGFFLIDIHAAGVEVRPLRQMTGDSQFNEVFLDDVFVPDEAVVGAPDQGWLIAQTTLASERSMYGTRGFDTEDSGTSIARAMRLYHERAVQDEELKGRLVDLWMAGKLLGWTNRRIRPDVAASVPAPVGKLGFARVEQDGWRLCADLAGEDGLLFDDDSTAGSMDPADVLYGYLRSRANSIEGGTSQIMRNIIAERVLGLPPEARSDKDRPWSQVPRN
jgi:alkylation response protein AidB-like acyl-CoA dehydrogenase